VSAISDAAHTGVGEERRRALRYPVRLPITLVAGGGDRPSVWGHTVDVCLRGLRVVTDTDLGHDSELTAFLDVDGRGQPIVSGIETVWTRRRGEQWVHGLLLHPLSPEDERRLLAVCTAAG
jgi:hypothetical protein